MARKAIPVALRATVLERDGYKCVECHVTEELALHHKLPVSEGGAHTDDNLVTLCWDCHKKAHIARGDWYAGKMLGKKPEWMQGKKPHTIHICRDFWLDLIRSRRISFSEAGVLGGMMALMSMGSQYALRPKTKKPANVTDIAKFMRMDRSNIGEALKRLEAEGLIFREKVGRSARFRLNPDMVSYI